LLQGRGEPVRTKETEGQMVRRVAKDSMGLKRILVLNDEAHHCYREKPGNKDIGALAASSAANHLALARSNNEDSLLVKILFLPNVPIGVPSIG